MNTGHEELEHQLSALQKENAELKRIIELHHQGDKVIEAERNIFRTRISELERALKTVITSAHPHPMEHGAMYEAWQDAKKALALQPEK